MDQIPEHYTTEFNTNWLHLSQQTTKRFDGCAMLDTIRGRKSGITSLTNPQ